MEIKNGQPDVGIDVNIRASLPTQSNRFENKIFHCGHCFKYFLIGKCDCRLFKALAAIAGSILLGYVASDGIVETYNQQSYGSFGGRIFLEACAFALLCKGHHMILQRCRESIKYGHIRESPPVN